MCLVLIKKNPYLLGMYFVDAPIESQIASQRECELSNIILLQHFPYYDKKEVQIKPLFVTIYFFGFRP